MTAQGLPFQFSVTSFGPTFYSQKLTDETYNARERTGNIPVEEWVFVVFHACGYSNRCTGRAARRPRAHRAPRAGKSGLAPWTRINYPRQCSRCRQCSGSSPSRCLTSRVHERSPCCGLGQTLRRHGSTTMEPPSSLHTRVLHLGQTLRRHGSTLGGAPVESAHQVAAFGPDSPSARLHSPWSPR